MIRPACRGSGVIRILLAEDQHLIRGALLALIGLEPDMKVAASGSWIPRWSRPH
jgi:two-component system, NarL family, response regulator DesR